MFGVWDNYAQQLLGKELNNVIDIRMQDKVIGYEVQTYRYDLLKLFFISVLWRASVSVHPFFARIRLGSFEPRARTMLQDSDPGGPDEFGVVLARFDHPMGTTILDPHPEKFPPGINYNRFYLGRYIVYIKTDRRPAPGRFGKLQMDPSLPLRVVRRDLERSQELPLLYNIVSAANKARRS